MRTEQLEDLRTALHAAVDDVLRQFEATSGQQHPMPVPAELPIGAHTPAANEQVSAGAALGAWTFRWPSGDVESFDSARWYEVQGEGRRLTVLLAWTTRVAWGRARRRAIVFHLSGSTFYPWTEFVETDDERYAAPIPRPDRPRSLLSEGDSLPSRFTGSTVAPSHDAFHTIKSGKSLRLVVEEADATAMVLHGYWVGNLRGRI